MTHRRLWLGLVAGAALACAGASNAADVLNLPDARELSLRTPKYLDDAPPKTAPTEPEPPPAPEPGLLMRLLDRAGVGKPLNDAGINIYGFIEGSYTYGASAPPNNKLPNRVFDTVHEDPTLNQLDLSIERTVDTAKSVKDHSVDVGAHVQWIYGADAGLIHSNGLFDWYDNRYSPRNQFDPVQAYIDVALPVGNGLKLRAGKFVTLLGKEVINPTQNYLFSHSYLFGYAIPFTHVGVLGTYSLSDELSVTAGFTRGWNQSLEDNNDAIDFLGSLAYAPNKKWSFSLSMTEGPEAAGDNGDYWTVVDLVASYQATDRLKLELNADYGDAPHALSSGDSAQWYGIAGYASYQLNKAVTLNSRLEWYDDVDGFTLGNGSNNVYEATLGVSIKPFTDDAVGSNLVIRPEIRLDYSDKPFFDNATDHYQFTAAIDAFFTF